MSELHLSSPEILHRAIARFAGVTVLVVGDLILDRFVSGMIERISPEAPIPVLHGRGETQAVGGAGNVVSNIVSLGGKAIPISALGNDAAARSIMRMFAELGVDTGGIGQTPDRMTSSKSRFSALNQQVLRFDEEEIRALDATERARLLADFRAALAKADIVILSDYGKGILLDGVGRADCDLPRGRQGGSRRPEGA